MVRQLVDNGNTVILIDHDPELIQAADRICELGPGAGRDGGKVTRFCTPKQAMESTANGKPGDGILVHADRRPWSRSIRIEGATGRNLKAIDVEFPLGVLCVITGLSGAGKTSLVTNTLVPALEARLQPEKATATPLPFESIGGNSGLHEVILIDSQIVTRIHEVTPSLTSKPLTRFGNCSPPVFLLNGPI